MTLPDNLHESDYWQSIYKQPTDYWQPALDTIRQRHQLSPASWERFALGKNAVFWSGNLVVKLSPPFWAEDLSTEIEVTRFVANRLPVTPEVLAQGDIGAWRYAVLSRVNGEPMRNHWLNTFTSEEKAALARQHGEVMAALHTLNVKDQIPRLDGDWNTPMLAYQRQHCEAAMRQAGVPEPLLADLARYLDLAQPLIDSDTDWTLLHGDLDAVNMLVIKGQKGWEISGLIDWGDARMGAITHEFISPCVHSYCGDRNALLAWYEGYGLKPTPEFKQNVMARAMLYYADEFTRYLDRVEGAKQAQNWEEVADKFWQI